MQALTGQICESRPNPDSADVAQKRFPRSGCQDTKRPGERRARVARDGANHRKHAPAYEVSMIAAEQLIASIAGQCDRNVGACRPRHEIRGNLRRVGERLVENRRHVHDRLASFLRGDVLAGVSGSQVGGDSRRML